MAQNPELVGHGRHELPVDLVIRAGLRRIGDGRLLLASHNPLQSMKMHEPLHGATRDVVPVAPKLMPGLAGPVAPPALAVGRLDLLEILHVLPGTVRGQLGVAGSSGMTVEGCRGDRQNTADRLDPEDLAMLFNEGDHLRNGRSSSAWAKRVRQCSDWRSIGSPFFRISLAVRSSRFSRSSSLIRLQWLALHVLGPLRSPASRAA